MKPSPESEDSNLETITLGAGCFWCTEAVFQCIPGVVKLKSGYMGGQSPNPTYEEVCTGTTGHAEVVQVSFDPAVTSLEEILKVFWKLHDPTTLNRQGADVGTQYRSAIFFSNPEQQAVAERSRDEAAPQFKDPIVTEITCASAFYPAESYHDDYYRRNPNAGYCRIVIQPKVKKFQNVDDL